MHSFSLDKVAEWVVTLKREIELCVISINVVADALNFAEFGAPVMRAR